MDCKQENGNYISSILRKKKAGLFFCFALIVATCAAYAPVHHYSFVDIDDGLYVYDNPHVTGPLSWSNITSIVTHSYVDNYAPIDALFHNFNVQMFGLNAGYHHVMNLAWHILGVILLFAVLRAATGFTGRS